MLNIIKMCIRVVGNDSLYKKLILSLRNDFGQVLRLKSGFIKNLQWSLRQVDNTCCV